MFHQTPVSVRDLPAVNATLNGTAAVLLVWGHELMRRRQIGLHKKVMQVAFGVSVVFLICYLVYHAQVGSVPFRKTGPVRAVYFAILISHTILAATVPFLAVITLRRGLKNQVVQHRRIAQWTYPIWLYVSVTGVVVYWMLYRM